MGVSLKSIILLIVAFFSLQLLGETHSLTLSSSIYQNSELPFISHQKDGRFGSYLTMNINLSPMLSLLNQLESTVGIELKSRGEAHITVITPIEFYDVLRKFISIEEIDQIALRQQIQSTPFDVVCLGRGSARMKGSIESTYFVVIESAQILALRTDIYNLFVSRGGNPSAFSPQHYFPHITLGFTKRDLHEADGVIKDRSSCIQELLI